MLLYIYMDRAILVQVYKTLNKVVLENMELAWNDQLIVLEDVLI